MIKTYTLSNNSEFKTITIPKGTLLFRGITFTQDTSNEYVSEFFNKGLCIPPTKNIYFYPAPYAGIGINPFNVYILYSTNYDLELLLLIKPSTHFRPVPIINGHLPRLTHFESASKLGHSPSLVPVFNVRWSKKGNYIKKYRVEDVFKRDDLLKPTRYKQKTKTRRLQRRG